MFLRSCLQSTTTRTYVVQYSRANPNAISVLLARDPACGSCGACGTVASYRPHKSLALAHPLLLQPVNPFSSSSITPILPSIPSNTYNQQPARPLLSFSIIPVLPYLQIQSTARPSPLVLFDYTCLSIPSKTINNPPVLSRPSTPTLPYFQLHSQQPHFFSPV